MQLEEAISERADEEMDVSDSDNESELSGMRKKPRYEEDRGNPNSIFSLKVQLFLCYSGRHIPFSS